MRRWPGTILGEWGASLLRAAGVPAPVAVRVAAVLVDADMAGYPRCGIVRIATYLSAIQRGELQASAQPQVAGTQPAAVIVRGGGGFGEEALAAAVGELAVRAGRLGVAAAAVRDAYPVGRLAPFVARLARRGRLAWAWTNGDSARPRVAAVPGGGACLSGGALAGAVPRGDGRLLLLDMCLAARPASAGGRMGDGQRPLGGRGGSKGAALCVATELLAGALTGAGCAGEAGSSGAGIFLLAVDVARLGPAACRQVERLCGFVRGAGAPAGGVWVPGELAARRRARQARDGVALAPAACRLLARWSARLGQRVPPCSAAPAEGLGPGAAAVGGSR